MSNGFTPNDMDDSANKQDLKAERAKLEEFAQTHAKLTRVYEDARAAVWRELEASIATADREFEEHSLTAATRTEYEERRAAFNKASEERRAAFKKECDEREQRNASSLMMLKQCIDQCQAKLDEEAFVNTFLQRLNYQ